MIYLEKEKHDQAGQRVTREKDSILDPFKASLTKGMVQRGQHDMLEGLNLLLC